MEVFHGETVWDGVVEVFHLSGHPKADTVYAWIHDTGDPEKPIRHVTVLRVHPALSPLAAVRAFIVQEFRMSKPKPRKPGRPKLSEAEAKGRIVPVRFKAEDLVKIAAAVRAKKRLLRDSIYLERGHSMSQGQFKFHKLWSTCESVLLFKLGHYRDTLDVEPRAALTIGNWPSNSLCV